ncbi:MAG: four helix bundle protein [Candidatus Sulfotelmatobacter sp.]
MKDFRRLRVWEKVHLLTLDIYRLTARFPREELYGLTSQMRRCSASMGANIAEGCGKQGNNELQCFLYIASGSASELDYHLLLARDLSYLPDEDYRRMDHNLAEARRMLTALLQKVSSDRHAANC